MTKREKQICVYVGIGLAVGVCYVVAPAVLPVAKANFVRVGIIRGLNLLV